MDITTWLGLTAFVAIVTGGAMTGLLPATFLNWHGLILVVCGTGAAMLLNTPRNYLLSAVASLFSILGERRDGGARVSAAIVALCEQVQSRGIAALQDADPELADGFLKKAAQTAIQCNNPELVEEVLEADINSAYDYQNEVVNVFRTMGVLAPMFGLLGTLIGIVEVLRNIANPEQVGPAMAVAVTTAFYGIAIANLICVPVAGKLRLRNWQQMRVKAMAAEGVVMIMRGSVPLIIERKLQSYL